MKKIICVTILMLSIFWLSAHRYAEDGLILQYAFIIKTGNDTWSVLDTSGTHTRIDPDFRVRILLRPVRNAYCYLFLHDDEGNLAVLFPEKYDTVFGRDTYLDTLYRVPGPASWLVPNGKNGTESFYLIVSDERLAGLESLAGKYLRITETSSDEKRKAGNDIVTEITMLRRMYSSFSEEAVSPTVIAGDYRGDNANGKQSANMIEVRALKFYAKTVRLVH